MLTIFWGFLLLFVNINLNIGASTVDLLPDFLGYFLIARGLGQIGLQSVRFAKARPWAIAMTVYTAGLYILNIAATSTSLQLLGYFLGIAALAANLYISFQIVTGITELELAEGCDLRGERLKTVWRYMAVLNVLSYLFFWIPIAGIGSLLAAFVVEVCFLVFFYKTTTLYRVL